MLFPSVTFALFFVAVYIAHILLETKPRWWKLAMLAASAVFYGWWDWRFCGLIAASIGINWLLGAAVERAGTAGGRKLVALAVIVNISLLASFKYYGFFVEALGASLGTTSPLPALDLILPVGISFFTFQALSYVIDIQRRQLEARPLLDFAVYLSFFPQLVAGPIVRASEFMPQLDRRSSGASRRSSNIDVAEAAWLIARGLFKKMVIASYLAETVVDPVFAAPSAAGRGELLLAFYGYAIQIYADFSGYTDMAIGIALLLGFRFPTNFNNPYRALSIQDFWQRWHMTLSRWLRDYLYIPLGGNRISELATYRNLMATMILGGLWHGAAWTFVVWGGIHGLALGLERFADGRIDGAGAFGRLVKPIRWFITFHIVAIAWVLFRAPSFEVASDVLTGLVTAPVDERFVQAFNPMAALVIACMLTAQLLPAGAGGRIRGGFARLDPVGQSVAVGVCISIIAVIGPEGVAPFIYFQF